MKTRVDDAVAAGAKVLAGGEAVGPCYRATLLADVPADSELARHETFGPVASIEVVDNADEAVARANATAYGLSAGIITSNRDRGFALAQRIDSGIVHVNDQTVGDEPQMPFGGVKDSGFGRFGGQAVVDEFTELRWVTMRGEGHPVPVLVAHASLTDAVNDLVRDGHVVALEGFTHLIPHAAGHELIRQGRRDLTLVRMTPDVVYDQLIGMGCARKLVFSWGGNPGVGSLHRLRDAVENGWPQPLELEEHSHAGMAAAYAAGAANLPFAVLRGYRGRRPHGHTRVASVTCPFTGEELAAVPAHRPDVGIVHAQQADRRGNVQLWGILGVQKEVVLASTRSIVTVEEIVDELTPAPERSCCRRGPSTRCASRPVARTRRTHTATTTATTTSTSRGTRSAATATRSARGWTRTCCRR